MRRRFAGPSLRTPPSIRFRSRTACSGRRARSSLRRRTRLLHAPCNNRPNPDTCPRTPSTSNRPSLRNHCPRRSSRGNRQHIRCCNTSCCHIPAHRVRCSNSPARDTPDHPTDSKSYSDSLRSPFAPFQESEHCRMRPMEKKQAANGPETVDDSSFPLRQELPHSAL